MIGVARADGSLGWGLYLSCGKLCRRFGPNGPVPLPDGWPDGHRTQVMKDEAGQSNGLRGKATGAVISVCIDHDAGTLGFRVNGGPLLEALKGFPVGAALRPWVCCLDKHQLSFAPPYS